MLKHCLTFCFALSVCSAVYGQDNVPNGNAFASDIYGRPLYLKTEYVADGSPYVYEDYSTAEVTTVNGKVYKNVQLRINLLENFVLYKLDNGAEMIMATPITEIRFYKSVHDGVAYDERVFRGYGKPLNDGSGLIYEVLHEDSSALLLKRTQVTFNDSKGYGEATVTRTFKRAQSYFAAIPPGNTTLQKIEKDRDAVSALFGNSASTVKSFINKNKIKCKSEKELIEVFRYYGTL